MTPPSRTSTESEDIAVIGLACLFPGAPDVGTFWRNIVAKFDAITDPPPEAWDPALHYDVSADENDRVYCKKGGYLGSMAYFDPLAHGIMPRAVEGGEPDQWLALHVAREALRDAGYEDATRFRERAALILGKGTYANRGTMSVIQHALVVDSTLEILKSLRPDLSPEDLQLIRADLKRRLPRFDSETAPALIPNVTAGRIANRLDFMGPSYTVDAACASSLVAIDIAVKGLRHGEYDLALVGGMQVATPVPVLSLFCRLKALSATERIRPFDKDADGTLLSEGIGMAVLKRRTQAEADGDRIYAVIKGTGVASDGRAVSVLAPRVEGEELAVRRAYENAGLPPQSIGLIEAHGTGTLVGDAVEVEALTRVFGEGPQRARCALGTVKSMIGHTMPAAGIAGFIKSVLSLYYKVLPPTLNVTEPSPRLQLERTPFYINSETRPWIHGNRTHARRAGINAFGFGGINAHVVVEEHSPTDAPTTHDVQWDSEVLVFRGESRDDVIALGREMAAALARERSVSIAQVAHSLNLRPAQGDVALGIVATSTEDMTRKLDRALGKLKDPACRRIKDASGIYFFGEPLATKGQLAFVFPGEGAQYVNMLADLCRHFPVVRGCFDEIDRIFAQHPRGWVLSQFLFPPAPFSDSQRIEAERHLWRMDIAIEAILTANHAIYRLLTQLGIRPDVVLGHSTGDFTALHAAGVLPEEYEQRIIEMHNPYERATVAGQVSDKVDLVAVGASRERVMASCAALGSTVCVAIDNCPHQVVMAAQGKASASLQAICRAEGLLYEVLSFDRPYHTPMFAEYGEGLREFFQRWITAPPTLPLYSCTNTGRYSSDLAEIRDLAIEHWMRPVEFRQTIEKMYADGVRIFVEAGPRGNLTAFIEDTLGRRDFAAIPANVSRRTGITQLNHLLAQLAAHGVALTLAPLYERRALPAFDWTSTAIRPAAKRPLGRVKIPTGAPEMHLSPEVVERLRARRLGSAAATPAAEPVPAVAPAPTAAVSQPTRATTDVAPGVTAHPASTQENPAGGMAPAAFAHSEGTPAHLSHTPGTSEVMSAFFQTMNRFLAVEQDLLGAAIDPRAHHGDTVSGTADVPCAATLSGSPFPFIQETVSLHPGARLLARCELDLETYPFLRDHTLGRNVSADHPALTGFPIVPFTALMEIMAEAAQALVPARVLIGMRDVRVHRWLALDRGPLGLDIRADRIDDDHVTVSLAEAHASEGATVAEGVMVFADRYVEPPAAVALDLRVDTASKWAPDQLYEMAMFHGPAFRGVRSMDRVGDQGATATLEVGDRRGLLAVEGEGLVTDFVLLDQPGQVVGFWASQFLERAFFVLPFHMRSLQLYGPRLQAGDRLTCVARISQSGDHQLSSTLDVVAADGRVWARFEGWEDHRFHVPESTLRSLLRPATASLARGWQTTGNRHGGGVSAFRIGLDAFPAGWLTAHGGIWSRVLAAIVLGPNERVIWHALKTPERRRLEWLLGRIAAKDAVRDHLQRRFKLAVAPADVEILPGKTGRPTASGAWTRMVAAVPLVSISHVDGSAVAVAGDGMAGLGVDLERHGRMKPGMEDFALTPREREMLADFKGEERQSWSLRLWCAKEASAKATGCEFGPASAAFAVERIHAEHGTVWTRYSPPGKDGVTLSAATEQDGEWVLATCIVNPGSRREEDFKR